MKKNSHFSPLTGPITQRIGQVLGWSFVFCLVLGFAASRAEAYTTLGYTWGGASPIIEYYINVNSFPSSVGTAQQVISAINNGADEWNQDGSANFTFVYMGTTTINYRSKDGINVVYYDPNECDLPGVSNCKGQTQWWTTSGDMSDFDITFNGKEKTGKTVNWDAVDPIFFTTDLWGWAAHEFGHALGLGHSSVTVATMNNFAGLGATWLRDLTSDDINGIQFLYGAR